MKKTFVFVVMTLIAAPLWVVAAPQEEAPSDEELQRAHHQLQEAIEKIRSYHMDRGSYHMDRAAEKHGALHGATRAELLFEIDRPRMGIVVDSTRIEAAEEAGARVIAVTPGGPADEAGIETGDVITHVDGVRLADEPGQPHDALVRHLRDLEEGDTVAVEFLRDGESRSATVSVRRLEQDHFVFKGMPDLAPEDGFLMKHLEPHAGWYFPHGWLDMELVALNGELGEYFGTDEGVLVVRAPESEELGLRGGDVIVSIDERVVKSPTHAMRILRSYEPDEEMTLEIMRRGRREELRVTMPDRRVKILEHWDEN